MDLEKLKEDQLKLAGKVVLSDNLGPIRRIAACDQAYLDPETIIGVIVIIDYKSKEVVEQAYAVKKTRLKYIPYFLSYREGPALIDAYTRLREDFDLLIVEGNGILHPRKMGIACHIGIHIGKPTIGVAKSLLCGEVSGNAVVIDKEVVGKVLQPYEHTKPVYISPGHMITLQRSYEVVRELIYRPFKLPYPLAIANKAAKKLKRKMKESGQVPAFSPT